MNESHVCIYIYSIWSNMSIFFIYLRFRVRSRRSGTAHGQLNLKMFDRQLQRVKHIKIYHQNCPRLAGFSLDCLRVRYSHKIGWEQSFSFDFFLSLSSKSRLKICTQTTRIICICIYSPKPYIFIYIFDCFGFLFEHNIFTVQYDGWTSTGIYIVMCWWFLLLCWNIFFSCCNVVVIGKRCRRAAIALNLKVEK